MDLGGLVYVSYTSHPKGGLTLGCYSRSNPFHSKGPSSLTLHVARIDAEPFDALYQFPDGKIALFQVTVAMHDISPQALADVLTCYTTATHTTCLEDFILVFVVPNRESAEPYLERYAQGKTFIVKGQINT